MRFVYPLYRKTSTNLFNPNDSSFVCLVCFLVCWLPFFVLNNLVNAIVKLSNKSPSWLITDFTLSLCVWLGYINSFLNPIIYTIFNLEFRKAFTKILLSICRICRLSNRSTSHWPNNALVIGSFFFFLFFKWNSSQSADDHPHPHLHLHLSQRLLWRRHSGKIYWTD